MNRTAPSQQEACFGFNQGPRAFVCGGWTALTVSSVCMSSDGLATCTGCIPTLTAPSIRSILYSPRHKREGLHHNS